MSLEAAVPILHAGSSAYWSPDVDPETTALLGSTLNKTKQPYLRTALLAPHGEGPRKGGLTKARLLSPSWLTAVNGHLLMRSNHNKERKVRTHL